MDVFTINQLVEEQLKSMGITDGNVYVLEKNWGYVVQVKNHTKYFNEIFDKDGNIICPFGDEFSDSGAIYATEKEEFPTQDRYGNVKIHIIADTPPVHYKELDANHFIIPRTNNKMIGSALFFVDENQNVTYKGYIEGRVCGSVLAEDKELIKHKQVLSYVDVDRTRNECEYFFYSWDKNCITSDKWSSLTSPNSTFNARNIILNEMHLPVELANEIIKYMQSNGAWLATLTLNSKDNEHHRNFVCLIGIDGIPLIDLTYISQTYSVDTIPLTKQSIGEVDDIKIMIQERMDKRADQIEANKKNIMENFLKTTGLTMKTEMSIEGEVPEQ